MSVFASFTNAEWGAVLLVLFGVFYWLGIAPGWRAAFGFLGVILIGTNGIVGGFLNKIAVTLANLTASIGGRAFGAAVPALLAIILLVLFIYGMHPKNKADKRTGIAGILLAAVIVAGVSGIQALNGVPGAVQTGVSNVQQVGG